MIFKPFFVWKRLPPDYKNTGILKIQSQVLFQISQRQKSVKFSLSFALVT